MSSLLTTRPSALRECDHCDAPQSAKRPLRRCGGCIQTMYCSKNCQKAAWPQHKILCRANAHLWGEQAVSAISQSSSFPSVTAYCDCISIFVETHDWALKAIARVAITLEGGIDWFLNPPKVLCICLSPEDPQPVENAGESSRMPTFKFHSQKFVVSEDLAGKPRSPNNWDRQAPVLAEQEERFRRIDPDHYVGSLPVCFSVVGVVGVHHLRLYPQFRRPSNVSDPAIGDRDKETLLEDAFMLFAGSIDFSYPLRELEGGSRPIAVPGRVVRTRGGRSWQAMFTDWSEYRRGIHDGLDTILDLLRTTNMRLDDLMAAALAFECI
ncbi:hypothetical protein K466DRAFT_45778 [Polyporus arcularius HHB13444]|uniref:MYND-type domain-containing protein n=1 Tax=Polyporus arcularius HHB13444 TaxID=1314778 RepID=A0A5C3NPL0_9APHY|nr:hypothetical protein K466DRAFT_45778 [Polyporus arcularius HHB13444]